MIRFLAWLRSLISPRMYLPLDRYKWRTEWSPRHMAPTLRAFNQTRRYR